MLLERFDATALNLLFPQETETISSWMTNQGHGPSVWEEKLGPSSGTGLETGSWFTDSSHQPRSIVTRGPKQRTKYADLRRRDFVGLK